MRARAWRRSSRAPATVPNRVPTYASSTGLGIDEADRRQRPRGAVVVELPDRAQVRRVLLDDRRDHHGPRQVGEVVAPADPMRVQAVEDRAVRRRRSRQTASPRRWRSRRRRYRRAGSAGWGSVWHGAEQNQRLATVNVLAKRIRERQHLGGVVAHRLDRSDRPDEPIHLAAVDLLVRSVPRLGHLRALSGRGERKRTHLRTGCRSRRDWSWSPRPRRRSSARRRLPAPRAAERRARCRTSGSPSSPRRRDRTACHRSRRRPACSDPADYRAVAHRPASPGRGPSDIPNTPSAAPNGPSSRKATSHRGRSLPHSTRMIALRRRCPDSDRQHIKP